MRRTRTVGRAANDCPRSSKGIVRGLGHGETRARNPRVRVGFPPFHGGSRITGLTTFQADFDWSTQRIVINLDPEAGYAIQSGRSTFEPAATRAIFNWLGNSNWLPGYRDYHGKSASQSGDSYATFMKTNYAIMWDFRPNGIMLSLNGVPPRADLWPHRYDTGLFTAVANGRDSWSADFRSFCVSWLSSH